MSRTKKERSTREMSLICHMSELTMVVLLTYVDTP